MTARRQSFRVIEGAARRDLPPPHRPEPPPLGAWLIAGAVCWSVIGVAAWAYVAARTMGMVR